MSTRSNINVKIGNVYHSVYCHFDGYPSGVGACLYENYSTQELAEELISYGDISILDESVLNTIFYGRDRGEENTEFRICDEPLFEEEYSYVWNGTEWMICGYEYVDESNMEKLITEPLRIVLGYEQPVDDTDKTESEKVLEYFGCTIDEVIAINEEWLAQYNTDDVRMTDEWNSRNRWTVKHRYAPYNGLTEDMQWCNIFSGSTLKEAARNGTIALQRGADDEKGQSW